MKQNTFEITDKQRLQLIHGKLERELFTINAKLTYPDVIELLADLANRVHEYSGDNDDWIYIGEHGYASISDMLTGAYWHLTEWHAGQYSPSYAAMCAIGQVFSPGMTNGCEPESSELEVFNALNELAESEQNKKQEAKS